MLTKAQVNELAGIATFCFREEEARAAMRKLREMNDTWHWCEEWDGLAICNETQEFDFCCCFDINRFRHEIPKVSDDMPNF